MSTILTLLNKRKKNNTSSIIVPWYLSGGISAANCIAAYQPKGAASQVASYVNLANPGTYDATPEIAPTWDTSTGWYGTNARLATGYTPADGNTASIVVRYVWDGTDTTKCIMGLSNSTGVDFSMWAEFVGAGMAGIYGVTSRIQTALTTDTVAILTATGYWVNGSAVGAAMSATLSNQDVPIALMCRGRQGGGFDSSLNGYLYAAAIYNVNISAYVAALTTAMNAL